MPGVEVYGPPLTLYSAPLLTLMVVGTFVPVTVIGFDTTTVDVPTLLSGVRLNGVGTALVPVPLRVTVVGVTEALLVISSAPFRVPSLPGVKVTSMVQLFPLSAALQLLVCE